MKKIVKAALIFFIASLTLASIAIGGLGWWSHKTFTQPGALSQETTIDIKRGTSVSGIAQILESNHVIEHALLFRLAAKFTKQESALKAGEYVFTPGISMEEALNQLERGETVQRRVTLREGLTSAEIIDILNTAPDLIKYNAPTLPKEGSLLPETYNFTKGEDATAILKRMNAAMTTAINTLWEQRSDNLPFDTKEQALTLASIVEKETAVPSERKRVAGVFVNRLRKGMKLQADPTVIYALNQGRNQNDGQGPLGRRLLRKDLSYDSPYNTYRYAGLPPGPIANPGYASIEAALNPEAHDYLYFVADGAGGHAFAKTLAGHNANVAKWRKIRAQQK